MVPNRKKYPAKRVSDTSTSSAVSVFSDVLTSIMFTPGFLTLGSIAASLYAFYICYTYNGYIYNTKFSTPAP